MNKSFLFFMTLLLTAPSHAMNINTEEMLNSVNQIRSQPHKCGSHRFAAAPPLKWHTGLTAAAQQHADDMATHLFFNHINRDGKMLQHRLKSVNYHWRFAAENISAGQRSFDAVLKGWMESEEHCRNLMSPQLQDVGMAIAINPKSPLYVYWVMDLGATY